MNLFTVVVGGDDRSNFYRMGSQDPCNVPRLERSTFIGTTVGVLKL